jgi:hypothetical protein
MANNPTLLDDLSVRFSRGRYNYDVLVVDELLREGRMLASSIVEATPTCREQSLAITRLDEAIQYAILALSRRSP